MLKEPSVNGNVGLISTPFLRTKHTSRSPNANTRSRSAREVRIATDPCSRIASKVNSTSSTVIGTPSCHVRAGAKPECDPLEIGTHDHALRQSAVVAHGFVDGGFQERVVDQPPGYVVAGRQAALLDDPVVVVERAENRDAHFARLRRVGIHIGEVREVVAVPERPQVGYPMLVAGTGAGLIAEGTGRPGACGGNQRPTGPPKAWRKAATIRGQGATRSRGLVTAPTDGARGSSYPSAAAAATAAVNARHHAWCARQGQLTETSATGHTHVNDFSAHSWKPTTFPPC